MCDNGARTRLAKAQEQLVAGLTSCDALPPGFDPEQFSVAASALRGKRRHSVGRSWPRLRESLGAAFSPVFSQYAESHELPGGGPGEDALRFAAYLKSRGCLPDSGRLEMLAYRLRRGRLPLRVAYLTEFRRVVIATRVGAMRWSIPLPRWRWRRVPAGESS